MSKEDLKKFLIDLKSNKELFESISNVGTAKEIAMIANKFGYKFTGEDLKNFSTIKKFEGVSIKKQDTSPSYSFGESGNWIGKLKNFWWGLKTIFLIHKGKSLLL